MKVWAIADTHLYFGTPDKNMALFGEKWENHPEKLAKAWKEKVSANDLVLIAGDISWGKHPEEIMPDLHWLDQLPGKKVLSKGNHDYWWPSNAKLEQLLPSSITFVNKSARTIGAYSIAGTRLWDHKGVNFSPFIEFRYNPKATHPQPKTAEELEHDEKIYQNELGRLEIALKQLDQSKRKIAMVHYPPLGQEMESTPASDLLEKYNVDVCIFGHIHNIKEGTELFDKEKGGVRYILTACDYLHYIPRLLFDNET